MSIKFVPLIDLTSLEGEDTVPKIEKLCQKALHFNVAAVCVYPIFVKEVSDILSSSSIATACVAGGFPASQIPLSLKCKEVEYCLKNGANEIDAVLSQGLFFEGKYELLKEEVRQIKALCGPNAKLKWILEVGVLKTRENIRKAAQIAIEAGADFIKTSTGKTSISVTPEAVQTMCEVIGEEYRNSGTKIGIKIAGGVSTPAIANDYISLVEANLGKQWLNPSLLRIGTSRLI